MESVHVAAFTTTEALLGGVTIGSVFVGGLYALGNRRLVACHWNRDHPQVIMDRIRAVFISCGLVAVVLSWLFLRRGVVTHMTIPVQQSITTSATEVSKWYCVCYYKCTNIYYSWMYCCISMD
jgi:hypothetical protein